MKKKWISFALLFFLALGSCKPATAPRVTPLPDSPTPGESTPMTLPTPVYANKPELVLTATADLAQRLSVSSDQITVAGSFEVVWPDGSLGCPQKGMAYIEMLIPGYLVVLGYDGKRYEYHSGRDGNVTYCPNPTAPVGGLPGDT